MYKGILEDNRPKELVIKNYDSRELDFGELVLVTEKVAIANAKAFKKLAERNQKSKSSCVPSSIATALFVTEQLILADEYLYSQRANKPAEGCYWYDICNMVVNQGICERRLMKEVYTELEANNVVITAEQRANAKLQKQKSFVFFDDPKIQEMARFLNQGFAIPFSFFSNSKEWSQEYPQVQDHTLTIAKATINHAVCAIPNTAYKKGNQIYFIILDSAHFGGHSLRHVSEDFIGVRAKHGVIFTDLEYQLPSDLSEFKGHKFLKDLTVGSTGDDVNMLQKVLQKLGQFPAKTKPTYYFGGITRQAVKDYQEENAQDILTPVGLKLGTGYFGVSTREFINNKINGN